MDPNENLREQRKLSQSILDQEEFDCIYSALRLAELVVSLDEWLRGGGFLPTDWQPK